MAWLARILTAKPDQRQQSFIRAYGRWHCEIGKGIAKFSYLNNITVWEVY